MPSSEDELRKVLRKLAQDEAIADSESKKCPYCAETIKAEATVCRHCGRDLRNTSSFFKKKWPVWIAISLLVLCGVFGVLWFILSALPSTYYRVTYKITGTASQASLTYENEQGGTEQTKVVIPWQETMTVKRGSFLYLSAQNDDESGSVTCEIWVDGVKWRDSTSRGAYVISTCSGRAGND